MLPSFLSECVSQGGGLLWNSGQLRTESAVQSAVGYIFEVGHFLLRFTRSPLQRCDQIQYPPAFTFGVICEEHKAELLVGIQLHAGAEA
jgi:hypothetical protein